MKRMNGLTSINRTQNIMSIINLDLIISFYSANEKVVIDFSNNGAYPGFLPDGLTIDTDGFLYVTFYGGSKISKVDPK